MKIALVGDAVSTRHLAPFADPTWEIWAAGNAYTHLKRATRYFELHGGEDVAATIRADRTLITGGGIETNFWDAPMRLGCSHIYTGMGVDASRFTRRGDGTPTVQEFPFEGLRAAFEPFYTSSFAWLLAFAITQNPDEIAMYGFDLSLEEYETQKPAICYFVGIATGRGIKVTISPRSMLLRAPFLYGLETAANRKTRSILMDQRYVIETELAKRKTEMDHAFYARLGAVNMKNEHQVTCRECAPDKMCARFRLILADFGTAVTNEVKADIEFGQIKARLDENTYYLKHLVIDDEYGPDQVKEDKGLAMIARPPKDEYQGVDHTVPLPKKLSANVRPNGTIDYEIEDGPSMTEVTRLIAHAKDGT